MSVRHWVDIYPGIFLIVSYDRDLLHCRVSQGIGSPQQEEFLYYLLFTTAQGIACYQLAKPSLLNEAMPKAIGHDQLSPLTI